MGISQVCGDVTSVTEGIIVHQVNNSGKMNSGVAKAIREKWKAVYTGYLMHYYTKSNSGVNMLGDALMVEVREGLYVCNLFGQDGYGYDGKQYTDYDALRTGLQKVASFAKRNGLKISLPYGIGCVRGGGDWSVVVKIIEEVLGELDVTLYKL